MSIASALGVDTKKVRYAVVGAGDITRSVLLPGIARTGGSKLVAIVSGDPEKRGALADRCDVEEGLADLRLIEGIARAVDTIDAPCPTRGTD